MMNQVSDQKQKLISEIRQKRLGEKISYRKLSSIYNISSSTIRNWCRDLMVSKSESLLVHHRLLRVEHKKTNLSAVPDLKSITTDQYKLTAALLYGCEGAKYPATKAMCFTNSDPNLVLTFYRILDKAFVLDPSKISLRIQIHSTQNYEKIREFWSRLLDIPNCRFLKPTITNPRNKKHHNNYQGTCTLKYQDYRLQLGLLGAYEEFIRLICSPK